MANGAAATGRPIHRNKRTLMLKIKPNPTFQAPVEIPTPEGPVKIKVEFKHRNREEFHAFTQDMVLQKRTDIDFLMEIMAGWTGVEGEFNREAVTEICNEYHQAADAIAQVYIDTQTQARRKN